MNVTQHFKDGRSSFFCLFFFFTGIYFNNSISKLDTMDSRSLVLYNSIIKILKPRWLFLNRILFLRVTVYMRHKKIALFLFFDAFSYNLKILKFELETNEHSFF